MTAEFCSGEPALLFDRKARKHLIYLEEGKRIQVAGGAFDCDDLIGRQPGARIQTHKGGGVAAYRPTLEDYVLLMPRAATVMPPKDIGYVIQWGDVFPGARVAEAGIGSGGLTLALLEAVGVEGHVTSFELRDDHAARATKNIRQWRDGERLLERHRLEVNDVAQGLGAMEEIDRLFLDLPEPWEVVESARKAIAPGGIWVSYVPSIRQVDRLITAILDDRDFAPAEVVEVLLRKWVADRQRLRPELTMVGHSGFLVRTRRRGSSHRGPAELSRPEDSEDGAGEAHSGESAEGLE